MIIIDQEILQRTMQLGKTEMTAELDEEVLHGLWQIIKELRNALDAIVAGLEHFYNILPEQHRANAAKQMDAVYDMMTALNALIEPLRQIMEEDDE